LITKEIVAKWSRYLENTKFWCASLLCTTKNPGDGTLSNPGGTANHATLSACCWLCGKMRPYTWELNSDGGKVFSLTFSGVPAGPLRDFATNIPNPLLYRTGETWEEILENGKVGVTGPVPRRGNGGKRGSTPHGKDTSKSRRRSSSQARNAQPPPLRVSHPPSATQGVGVDVKKVREDHAAKVRNSLLEQDLMYLAPPLRHANDETKAAWEEHRGKVAHKTMLDYKLQWLPDCPETIRELIVTVESIETLAAKIREKDPAHMLP
jgi:hypothetical protein